MNSAVAIGPRWFGVGRNVLRNEVKVDGDEEEDEGRK